MCVTKQCEEEEEEQAVWERTEALRKETENNEDEDGQTAFQGCAIDHMETAILL